jgi:hypothetical protein
MDTLNDEVVPKCAVCSTDLDPDNGVYTTKYDDIICGDCVISCDRCSDIVSTNDTYSEIDGSDIWCESCIEHRAYWCDYCESYTSDGTSGIEDRDESWCSDCTSNAYWCDNCEQYFADGCDRGCDGESNRVIHDYSYRPDAIFHSTDKNERLFFGIEIEVEAGRNINDASQYAFQLEAQELAYLKHDGSLNCGFEVVTHPMSHEFFKNQAEEFWDVIEGLRSNYKVKSWGTSTCGLHIHISRSGFSSGAHMHRFLNLVYSNQEFYETLAGRSSDQWAKFTDIYQRTWLRDDEGNRTDLKTTRTFAHKLNFNYGSDRYSAVNAQNRETLEMRIFRGTVNTNTIKAHIDLAHASVEYTRVMSVKDILQGGALKSTQFIRYIAENEEKYPDLFARVSKLILPTSGLTRQKESV